MHEIEWTEELSLDLEKLIELAGVDPAVDSDKIRLKSGERRHVSILFLDMKGYTALSEKYDHEIIDGLIDKVFTIFKRQIDHRGGWIEKFEGDSILAAFGAEITHEDDAIRAIDSGLAILDAFDQIQPVFVKHGIDIGIRIGIHSGEVTRSYRGSDAVITGDAVNTAARIQQIAEAGALAVSSATRKLAESHFMFSASKDVSVKGKQIPIRVSTVIGKCMHDFKRQVSSRDKKFRLIGRERELEFLKKHYSNCKTKSITLQEEAPSILDGSSPSPHLVIEIQGDAGIGKSCLVQEFLRQVSIQSTTSVLIGAAAPFASRPFEAIISMLMSALGMMTYSVEVKSKLEDLIEKFADDTEIISDLRNSIPILGFLLGIKYSDPRLIHLREDQFRIEIFLAIRTLIQAFSIRLWKTTHNPLVLVFEDFHWLDDSSRNALVFLLDTIRTLLPLMIILISRPDILSEESREDPLKKLPRKRIARFCMPLESLSEADETSLIDSILCEAKMPILVKHKIRERSSGNPYYIEELIHHMVDRGMIVKRDNEWQLKNPADEIDIPISIRHILLARIDLLDAKIRKTLQRASVLGREFMYYTLRWIEDRIEDGCDPRHALDYLVGLHYLISRDSTEPLYLFKHALTRDVAYDTLLHQNRRLLHRLCAEFIEQQHADHLDNFYIDLGEHWVAAGNLEKGAKYLLKAGDLAMKCYDSRKAIDVLTQAILILPDSDLSKCKALMDRGQVYLWMKKIESARCDFNDSLKLALIQRHGTLSANAYGYLGVLNVSLGNYEDALKFHQKAIDLFRKHGDQKGEAYSLGRIGVIMEEKARYEESLQFHRQSLQILKRLDDPRGMASGLMNFGNLHLSLSRYREARHLYKRSLRISMAINDRECETNALNNLGHLSSTQGRSGEAIKWYRQALEISQETGNHRAIAVLFNNLGIVYKAMGQYKKSVICYRDSLNIMQEMSNRRGEAYLLNSLGALYRDLNQYENALENLSESIRIFQEIGDPSGESNPLHNLGTIYFDQGLYGQAIKWYQKALRIRRSIKKQHEVAETLINMGLAFFGQKKNKRALTCYREALHISRLVKHRRDEADALVGISAIQLMDYQFPSARGYLQKALTIFTDIDDPIGKANVFHYQGIISTANRRYVSALEFFDKAAFIRKKHADKVNLSDTLHWMGTVQLIRKNYLESEKLFRSAIHIKESLGATKRAVNSKTMLARVILHLGNMKKAHKLSEECILFLDSPNCGPDDPELQTDQILFTHYVILASRNDLNASYFLKRAIKAVRKEMDRIEDPESRQAATTTPWNEAIIKAWLAFENKTEQFLPR